MNLKKVSPTALALYIVGLTLPAYADKTYTPAQLRDMVQSGNYPKQGAASTQTKSADYASCIAQIEAIVSSVRPNYPTQTIVSTNLMRTEKVWTNDAAMTLTCSAPEKKLIITMAPYL